MNKPNSKRQSSKQKRKEAILANAETLFLKKGIDNTTMNDIADETGIGIATLFRYFPKKEMIIVTIATDKIALILDAFQEIANKSAPLIDKLTMIMDFFIKQMTEGNAALPKLLDNFINVTSFGSDSFEDIDIYLNTRKEIDLVFKHLIDAEKSDGSIRSDIDATKTISTLVSNFSVFTLKLSLKVVDLREPDLSPEEQLEIMKGMFLDYIRA
ncbi:TetR/AcrR family transcriptional regulator [Bacillus sp. 1P06AnD]|uniref:TetR/AcrR family transcriptional regulator n=1 Tax=Bacillus sp. 1P06AnD TaxID=3132208 RepID=UPI00399FC278